MIRSRLILLNRPRGTWAQPPVPPSLPAPIQQPLFLPGIADLGRLGQGEEHDLFTAKGPSGNKVYILLLAPRPAGKARATSIPGAVCKERATPPAGLRAAARRGAAAGGHLPCCRSSAMSDIAFVAAPRICPPGARAKMGIHFCASP